MNSTPESPTLNPPRDFLNAVFAHLADTDNPVFSDLDGKFPDSAQPAVTYNPENPPPYTYALTAERHVAFVFHFDHDPHGENAWRDDKIPPTAVIWNSETLVRFWAFHFPQPPGKVEALAAKLDITVNERVCIPGQGWQLLHADADAAYHPEELSNLASFFVDTCDSKEPQDEPAGANGRYAIGDKYGDAVVMREYRESDFLQPMNFSAASRAASKNWKGTAEALA